MNQPVQQARPQAYAHQSVNQQLGQALNARLSQVAEQQGAVNFARERLDKSVHALIERLQPILDQSKEQEVLNKPCPPDVVLVPVADQLCDHSRAINRVADLLENITSRVEL